MTSYDEKLLLAVSQHPVLYNHTRSDYKNSENKSAAWEAVRNCLDATEPVDKIRQRWKSIRDSYVKYLHKMKECAESKIKIRPYKFEKHLKFLNPFILIQKDSPVQMQYYGDDSRIESAQLISVSHFPEEDDRSSSSTHSTKKRKWNGTIVADNISTLNENYRALQQIDEVDIFFLSLAQTVKKLRPLTVAKLKKELANLVTDAEIRELEEMEYVVVNNSF